MNSSSSASAMSPSPNLKQRSLRPFVVLCLLLFGLSLSAFAQTATIVGTVTDPSGSVVPNVTVTATSVDTAQTRTITTGDVGQYVTPRLTDRSLQRSGQGCWVQGAGQDGRCGQHRRPCSHRLPDGNRGVTETVTVEATAVRVQSDTGEVESVITGRQVTQLSTNGSQHVRSGNADAGAPAYRADFQTPTPVGRRRQRELQRPSRMATTCTCSTAAKSTTAAAAAVPASCPRWTRIAEFRVLTSNYSAEYGLSSAATITSVIKSGTKQFHASAWGFTRNDALDARNYFNPSPGKVAELRFNTYGFNVGGQVPIWKSHQTFFFYNMEWRSLIQGGPFNQTVPLTSTYGGDFAAEYD